MTVARAEAAQQIQKLAVLRGEGVILPPAQTVLVPLFETVMLKVTWAGDVHQSVEQVVVQCGPGRKALLHFQVWMDCLQKQQDTGSAAVEASPETVGVLWTV